MTPPAKRRTAVVALGGNAITAEGQAGTYDEMLANCQEMAKAICEVNETGWRVLVTHGNGPQVGSLDIQQDAGRRFVPAQPLHALGAMSQGLIGHLIETALRNARGVRNGSIVAVTTHVRVDADDPAFDHPTKPIGPFYSVVEARAREIEHGWHMVEDAGRGYRRVVPSPRPIEVLESDAILSLLDNGFLVIAGGGGGIPVVERNGTCEGVEAVIDKDRSAAVLAASVGADALVLVTGIDAVQLDYGTPLQRELHLATSDELRAYAADGQFPAGSMGPKVESALDFVDGTDGVAVITSAGNLTAALEGSGTAGTRIVRGR